MTDTITTELKCFDCGFEWSWSEESGKALPRCPECGSDDVLDPATSDLNPIPVEKPE